MLTGPQAILAGRIIVIAGEAVVLSPVCASAADAGAFVAFVSGSLARPDGAQMFFRAPPVEPDIWTRTAMHIEQQLGPVDAVVVDASAAPVVSAVFQSDLTRRGHGGIVVVADDDTLDGVLTRLADTQRAEPA